ncbi:MAG: DUF2304 domain-containing protein [Patescibacteria group bacterium]
MLIKIILLIIVAIIVLRLIFRFKGKDLDVLAFISWLAIWVLAAVIVVFPELTSFIASRVGIGRGADLVVYLSIIFIFYLLFRLLLRLERIEKNITQITSHLALKEKDSPHDR